MGVHNFTKLLRQDGWLPSNTSCCSTSLWRDPESMHSSPDFAKKIVPLQANTLLIDGVGLAFHLHRVAYARHIRFVVEKARGGRTVVPPCCKENNQKLSQGNVTKLVPTLLPLGLLDDVSREFVSCLRKHSDLRLITFWDGELRREMKKETDLKRRLKFPLEWSALQHYCNHGLMPSSDNMCGWESQLPKNGLFIEQIFFTLRDCQVEIHLCTEEADVDVAREAFDKPDTYVVGYDSDFCLFPSVKYVPLSTLAVDGSNVSGCVITREYLSKSLNLPDEEAIIEMAILMGNDYIDPETAQLDCQSNNYKNTLKYLRLQGEGYRVSSPLQKSQTSLRFIRTLYSLGSLEEFPLYNKKELHSVEEKNLKTKKNAKPKVPDEFSFETAAIQPLENSVKDAVLRCLTAYLNQQKRGKQETLGGSNIHFGQEHFNAFQQMNCDQSVGQHQLLTENNWRPNWKDVTAAYLIEKCIAHALKTMPGKSAPFLLRFSPPTKLFNLYLFHATLQSMRSRENIPPQISLDENSAKSVQKTITDVKPVLPIDAHERKILDSIQVNRVTIIQGETGCGKSSRVPIMILNAPPPDSSLNEVKIFVSQPRRIAAKALVERVRAVEPVLGKAFALRMGHGVREYESDSTRAWFVTTGYLVRLLANHPDRFNEISHIIIDEVHERSVDTDILCLLCRRLLDVNSHIRLVLMSATLSTSLYQDYFNVRAAPIFVGARRFPIQEIFVEDIPIMFPSLPQKQQKAIEAIQNECNKKKCLSAPQMTFMQNYFHLTAHLTMLVGRPGSSVLIFVPGMNEIVAILEQIEKLYVPGITYSCFPIHSDIPFEDQMAVFKETGNNEVKVVIATNAAESSITLPDVDHIICLGLCKQIMYNELSHRQMLIPCWISRASATQRAGRAGRLRPGNVYRLYTREAYEYFMAEFEPGEMVRMPLDSVILMLKEMLQEEAKPVLLDCLEPPNLFTIEKSFDSLFESDFITEPGDRGEITSLGSFVSALGLDLKLGSIIGLGIQMGVAAEAIELAAILSFPKTPWMMSSPLYHDPKEYNKKTLQSFTSRCHFDANTFSEPFATMNLIWDYDHVDNKTRWSFVYGVALARIKRLVGTRNNLRSRVADFHNLDPSLLKVTEPPATMPHSKLTILRVIQVWVFSDTLIEYSQVPPKAQPDGSIALSLQGPRVDTLMKTDLEQVLSVDRHPFELRSFGEIQQHVEFEAQDIINGHGSGNNDFDLRKFLCGFEERFLSFTIEKQFDLMWFLSSSDIYLYVKEEFAASTDFEKYFKNGLLTDCQGESLTLVNRLSSAKRGRSERPCGIWSILHELGEESPERDLAAGDAIVVQVKKFRLQNKKRITENVDSKLFHSMQDFKKCISCDFSRIKGKKAKKRRGRKLVNFVLCGDCSRISKIDLCDLLANSASMDNIFETTVEDFKRSIHFLASPNEPLLSSGKVKSCIKNEEGSSWTRPLLHNVAEGARMLSVLASGRRRENNIQLVLGDDDRAGTCVSIDKRFSNVSNRWKRLMCDLNVFVPENSVPASVFPVNSNDKSFALFCCCSNTLELRGGAIRAEGLTLLPPGRLFLLLSLITFGRKPEGIFSISGDDGDEENGNLTIEQCMQFLGGESMKNEWMQKIALAQEFHKSCSNLGEKLMCFPDKVRCLCKIFDFVDGYNTSPWNTLDLNPFNPENFDQHISGYIGSDNARQKVLPANQPDPSISFGKDMGNGIGFQYGKFAGNSRTELHMYGHEYNNSSGTNGSAPSNNASAKVNCEAISDSGIEIRGANDEKKKSGIKKKRGSSSGKRKKKGKDEIIPPSTPDALCGVNVTTFPDHFLPEVRRLFVFQLSRGEQVAENELPATNILSLLFHQYLYGKSQDIGKLDQNKCALSLTKDYWIIHRFINDRDGKEWYRAMFTDTSLRLSKRKGKGSPRWSKSFRPHTSRDAKACIPVEFCSVRTFETTVLFEDNAREIYEERAVLFESVEWALRMEAAFWLERQFCVHSRHWFEQSFAQMFESMVKRTTQK